MLAAEIRNFDRDTMLNHVSLGAYLLRKCNSYVLSKECI